MLDDGRLDEIANQYEYTAEKGVVERGKTCDFKFGREYESGGAGCISTIGNILM